MTLAEVAVNVPVDDTFHYIVPEGMNAKPLLRAAINFGGRNTIGFIMGLTDEKAAAAKIRGVRLKELSEIIDEEPVIDKRTVEIARWMSQYYIHPFGETLFTVTPGAKREKKYSHPYHYTGKLATLNPEQESALKTISADLGQKKDFLIHGITGSGKTEVYKHLVKKALEMGRSSIILVPEIALTPQNLERFYESFGEEVSIYHSKLTQSEKLGEWMKALRGKSRVVIGPRSAVFSPVKDLGLIIIDEEHESSYKSNNSPRYHARQVAFHRVKTEGATLVLGSATPQIETYYYAKKNDFALVELKNRYGGTSLPSVTIIDLKDKEKEKNLISVELLKKMLLTLERKKQVLLFLNRRGFSPVLFCKDCGHVFQCPNCNVSLTFHRFDNRLNCHHCGHSGTIPKSCPKCRNENLIELGSGTEKLEYTIQSQFPNYRIERMDLDTTKKRTSYIDILDKLKKHEVDIIIGTQMVAKGHDIAGIHLVGVILPDIILNIPDFRSTERCFILLTQVIGRAGRREDRGEAVIQTYLPEHYSIVMAARQDYARFYEKEIVMRKQFNYPPFKRIGRVVFRGQNLGKLEMFSKEMKAFIKKAVSTKALPRSVEVLGPVSCPIEKLKNNYRHHIIIKSSNINEINGFIRKIRDVFKADPLSKFLFMEIDIDPLSLV